ILTTPHRFSTRAFKFSIYSTSWHYPPAKMKLFLLILSTLSAWSDWSQWRGPKGNGNFDHEIHWSHKWPVSGPKKLWSTKVHIGYSGIAVSE
ncbi:MAG TPA: hypothetical protein DCG41_11505, partial [Verrucomicrobiales bacterium]|nr:hypothetical protein [Verrucomicrobiales bacterium]